MTSKTGCRDSYTHDIKNWLEKKTNADLGGQAFDGKAARHVQITFADLISIENACVSA